MPPFEDGTRAVAITRRTRGVANHLDLKNNVFFRRNDENIAYEVSKTQLSVLEGLSVADLFMSKGHIREPHWHPNANELDVVISGELIFAILDPGVPQLLTYHVGPGQSVFIPQGWWHWIIAVSDETHDHVIFDTEQPESVEGSDVLRLTPPEVFQLAYGVDAEALEEVLEPINQTVVIGPVSPQVCDDREPPDEDEDEDEEEEQDKERARSRHRDKGKPGRR